MGPLSMTALFVAGTFVAGLTFDMGINALQNWYDTVYLDAFWQHHPTANSPEMLKLSAEERQIDKLMRMQDFVTEREAK